MFSSINPADAFIAASALMQRAQELRVLRKKLNRTEGEIRTLSEMIESYERLAAQLAPSARAELP